jgi:metal-responsive CopG/Arc/MetJ family transcriptional regulator
MREPLVTTSIRIQQSILDKLQEIVDNDPRISSRTNLIKNILIDYIENK